MFLQGIGLLAGAVALEGLSGAVKVCAEYQRGPSGKVRCMAWQQGRGKVWNPETYKTIKSYVKPGLRKAAAEELDSKYMRRKYRYRKTLPYLPIEYIEQEDEELIALPEDVEDSEIYEEEDPFSE